VYATGYYDDAIAIFSRNSSTGALTYVELKKDGVGGVDALSTPYGVAVTPDGNHVYATGYYDDGIAVFSRNSSTGALTYVELEKDGVGGVDGLGGVKYVAISPDGLHVYAAGYVDKAVAVFEIVSATAPGSPTSVSATGGNGRVTVSWTPPASNGGASITQYMVTSSPGSLIVTTAGTSATLAGLTNGTQYRFEVTATNFAGTGSASSPSNAITPATVPGGPIAVSAAGGDAHATVLWTAPISNGGATITQYTVTSSPSSVTATTTGTSVTVTGLTNGANYTFTVTATNSAGTGSSSVASGTTNVPPPLGFSVETSSASVASGNNAVTAGVISGGVGTFIGQINWGDGTTESATVTGNSVVGGKHIYASAGTYTATITVTDSPAQQAFDSIVFTVNGANATVTIPSVGPIGMGIIVFSILTLSVWMIYKRNRARVYL
jgi:hypothetical protein